VWLCVGGKVQARTNAAFYVLLTPRN